MAQISKYPISETVYKRCWEIFTKTLINVRNSDDAQKIISDLLTPTERIVLMKRLAVALLLTQGYEYKNISQILKVSSPTIAAVNTALKFGNNGYKKAVDAILSDEKFKEQLNQLAQKMVALPAKSGMGSGTWRYLKQELQKSSKDKKPF
ncbi:hypothetical protein HY385_02760 [Candidatus Daviesbacteria bacterium]|nr:hypothetical protein [Candidatus Daviesbacteria bacterium]